MTVVIHDTYSDLHKEVYGFRPRNVYFATQEEYEAEYDRLLVQLEVVIEDNRKEQIAARKAVKNRIRNYMKEYGIDAVTALRWDFDAHECEPSYDWCDYLYQTNVGYWFNYRLLRSGIKPPSKLKKLG